MNSSQQKFFDRSEAPGSALRRPLAGVAVASVLLLASPAYAADWSVPLPDMLRGSQTVIGPATYPRWDGFYFGGQMGQSFANADFGDATSSQISYILANSEVQDTISGWSILPQAKTASVSYGAFIGYNIQWGEVVTGVELNYNHVALNTAATGSIGPLLIAGANQADGSTVMYNAKVNATASLSIHDIVTARWRAGWTIDRLLPYGFVGIAIGRADTVRSVDIVTFQKSVTPAGALVQNPFVDVPISL